MALNLTFWDNQQNPVNTTVDRIMDALRNDDMREGLIYEPCTMDDVLDGTQSAEALIMDAIVSQYSKLTAKMNIMQRAMTRSGATVDGINEKGEKIDIPLTVIGYQISDPFMRLGTANVVALFELSDGQTVSIYFHNPDTTPKKITAQDEVISFKWLLNKKDITIVVAPERGKDINALQVAMRIMKIAAKNSAAFTRQNKNRAERLAKVTALRELVAEKEKILAQKMKKIDELKYLKSQEELDRLDEEDRLMKGEITASLYQELKERNRLEDRQDELDNLFNGRILVIRSALQKEGWNGELYKELNKEGIYLKTEWETTKDTGNTLGMSYHISEVDFHYVDDLTDKPEEIAQKINTVIQPLLAKLLAEQKASAQTDKKDDEEQPIIITGKEFGEFDTSTKEGKAALREKAFEHLKSIVGKKVYSKTLNADVEFTSNSANKYKKFGANPVKLMIAARIEDIVANGIKFKESQDSYDKKETAMKYHYLKTEFSVNDTKYGARVVVREDHNGTFHYDLQVADSVEAILDSVDTEKAIDLPLTKCGDNSLIFQGSPARLTKSDVASLSVAQSELQLDNTAILDSAQAENVRKAFEYAKSLDENLTLNLDDTIHAIAELENALEVVETNAPINEEKGNLEQAELERQCAESFKEAIAILKTPILDDVGEGRYVLNLFIFDKDGNEIKDEDEHIETQPIIITGKEFGEFDTSTPEGKATLREKAFEHLKGLAEHNEMVFCNALNADIEFTVSGAKKYKKFSGNPIKSKLAIKIKELIAGGKVFKESEERYDQTEQGNKLTYHYLKNSAFVDEQEYGVRMVIREDSNGHFHYDLQINDDGVDAILDSINENNAILLPVTRRGLYGVNSAQSELHFDSTTILDNAQVENINHAFEYAKTLNSNLTLHLDDTNLAISELENALQVVETNAPINEKEGNLEQAQLERHCAKSFKEAISILKKPILDDVGEGRYVLNLFVFDKDGNEIKDEEEPELTGEEHQDKENYEKMLEDKANRKRSMSEEMKAEFTAFLRQYGFDEHHLADIPVGSTSFYVGKEQNGLKIDIEAAFTNSQVERHQDAYYDFTVTGDKTALVGEEADDRYAYFYTNNFEDALKWANEWLDKNKGELMQTTEPTQEQADRQFLQDIIDRKIDVLADDFYDKLEPIANRVYTYDEELLKKAIDNYATITDEYAVATE